MSQDRSLKEQTLRLLSKMQARVDAAEARLREPVAIVGMALRLPGADTPDQFWEALTEGRDLVREVLPERWKLADPASSARFGGFLDGIDRFDAEFFGISPREAASMDPQQRLVLEVAWHALEDAGIRADRLEGSRTGVYLGICTADYGRLGDAAARSEDGYAATGGAPGVAAGRLAYALGLNGPALVTDTACSSSLVATHLAIQALRTGECDLALAGGVNLTLAPFGAETLGRMQMLSPDGRCKAFDARADGFVRAEGCGVLVLKRLADATRDGDHVHALIRGSALGQDGRSAGLTAPSRPAQEAVIRAALANAGLAPADVDAIEAHGTGTALGDPIEMHALAGIFRERDRPLWVGSVKSNIGHAEAAAGIAGLIKAALMVERGAIPPSIHFERLNPHVDLAGADLRVPTSLQPGSVRAVGVSSFGFSGTNAHLVVAPPPAAPPAPLPTDEPGPSLLISAHTPTALRMLVGQYRQILDRDPSRFADLARNAARHRARLRWWVRVDRAAELAAAVPRDAPPPSVDAGPGPRVPLPLYPFERQRFWLDTAGEALRPARNPGGDLVLEAQLWPGSPLIAEHVVHGRPLLPAAAILLRLDRAARAAGRTGSLVEIDLLAPVEIRHPTRIQTVVAERIGFYLDDDGWRLCAQAGSGDLAEPSASLDLAAERRLCPEQVDPADFQAWLAATGLVFGPSYDALREIHLGENRVLARLESPLPEILLDAALRAVGALHLGQDGHARIPARIGAFHVFAPLGDASWVRARIGGQGETTLADLDLLDEAGGFVARIERLELRAPGQAAAGWRDWLHAVRWQEGPSLADAARITAPLADSAEHGRRLDRLAARYAKSAVGQVPEEAVAPRHLPLYRQLVRLAADAADSAAPAEGPEQDLLHRCGLALPAILRGEQDPLAVLFADGGPAAIYREAPAYRAGNQLVALAARFAAHPAGRLRVLEIGAGTGGTTAAVLEALGPGRTEYWFTDVSESFLDGARTRFPGIRAHRLDIERPLEGQAVPEAGFDLVLAANVLHATADLRQAVRHAASALRPGGSLVLLESTTQGGWIDLVFGLTEGWWRFADRDLRPNYPLLTEAGWSALLVEEGFDVLPLPGAHGTLPGQAVLLATPRQPVRVVQDPGIGSLSERCMALVDAVRGLPPDTRRLVVQTSGARTEPGAAALWGMARTLRRERPELDVRCLDLAGTPAGAVLEEERFAGEAEIIRDGDRRLVPRLQPAHATGAIPPLDPAAWYLVTGAFGGLGPVIAGHLADAGARRLVLVGRNLPSEAGWLDGLRARSLELRLEACDVGDISALGGLLDRLGPIRGVVHAAGSLADATFDRLDRATLDRVLRAKVDAADLLDRRLPDADPFVLFSSAVGLFGSAGQAAHVAASTALDAIAERRQARGHFATSIAWGAWDRIGAAATRHDLHDRLNAQGLRTIPPEQGRAILDAARSVDAAAFLALPIDRQPFLASFGTGRLPDVLAGWQAAPKVEAPATPGPAPEKPAGSVAETVAAEAARVLGHPDPRRLPTGVSLFEQGLDSLMAVQLRNRLFERFGEPAASATLLFDFPTLDALAAHLSGAARPAPAPARTSSGDAREPIAIVGIGCRFPGDGADPAAFWQALLAGTDAIGPLPAQRRQLPNHGADTLQAAFLPDIAGFDAPYFGISPREAPYIDPQHRLLLEVAAEALADAGIDPATIAGSRTGVFVGMCNYDYAAIAAAGEQVDGYAGTGSAASIAAGRLSYTLGLNGPALVTDTACSSSLVTVHLAVRSLRGGECAMALAGGVNLIMGQGTTAALGQLQMMAPDSRCKAFDDRANGFVRGEGCGLVVLKRLSDALADGDPIHALILGSALNQDGRSAGLTAPSGAAQEAVIRTALADAGVAPGEIDLVEAHGTGTALGDPIEVHALREVFAGCERPLWVGAVKTNLGHTEAAAGIAGLIKAALALRHGRLPGNLHFERLNPHIDLRGADLRFPDRAVEGQFRHAGVSSFGFSGTNAHVVLAAPPAMAAGRPSLPLPRFQRRRYWVEPRKERRTLPASIHPLLGRRLRSSVAQRQFEQVLAPDAPAWLADHRVEGRVILPAAAMVEMMLAAVDGPDPIELAELVFHAPLDLGPEPLLHTVVDPDARTVAILRVPDEESEPFQPLATARFAVARPFPPMALPDGGEPRDVDALYAAFARSGLAYGPAFRGLAGLRRQEDSATAELAHPADPVFRLDPRLLDAAWQGLAALLPEDTGGTWLLARVDRLAWFGGIPQRVLVRQEDEKRYQVTLLDADGGIVARCEGVGMARIARAGGQAAIHDLALHPLPPDAPSDQRQRRCIDLRGRVDLADMFGDVLEAAAEESAAASPQPLLLLTDRALSGGDPAQAAMTGLVGTIAQELPELDPRLLDLPGDQVPVLPQDPSARLLCLQDGKLARQDLAARPPAEMPTPEGGFVLRRDPAATSRSLAWESRAHPAAGPGEVVIEIAAAGINFRDVMNLLGLYPGDAGAPGVECAGVVVEAGPGVADLAPGMAVVAIAAGCFADRVRVDARLARPVPPGPPGLDWTVVAGQPVAHLTAMLALDGLRPGERVLVHAGAGGVGHAVLTLARAAGASLVATAGSPAKRAYLQDFGDIEVHDSRSLAFAATAPVDRLVNCLTGDAIPASLDLLAPGGRFVELGRAGIWTEAQAKARRPDVAFEILALDRLIQEDPARVGAMLDDLLARLANGSLPPVPVRPLPFARLPEAVRELEAARHVGKLVLRRPRLRPDATYLVTGGTGALGQALLAWLAAQGARHLLVLARRPQRLAVPDAEVSVVAVDLADEQAVAATLAGLAHPLKGVFHLAGALDDGVLAAQDADRLARTLAPKLGGAESLDRATRGHALDHFVLFGSLAGLTGSPGQANYAAANAALAGLARRRRAQGLPALLVDWAAWAGSGMAARRAGAAIAPSAALAALGELLCDSTTHAAVLPAGEAATAGAPAAEALPDLQPLPASERRARLGELVASLARQILDLGDLPLDPARPLTEIGLDSLMAVELRNALVQALGRPLPPPVVLNYPSVELLTAHLSTLYAPADPSPPPPPAAPPAAETDDDASIIDELERELARAGY
ncbi:SDR family NAD(P)-dependent oxidoreductase [Geminicoccus roseus]|uniref:SDR family NAD(P)-dependent oxidoreductase n=1 Tax=Geminicoccus roseus TaxID=404900 RepID=UPI0003FAD718|nr:SDR family NAD(P)-dependent oxidoreductase [Geminicoccus roseus]